MPKSASNQETLDQFMSCWEGPGGPMDPGPVPAAALAA